MSPFRRLPRRPLAVAVAAWSVSFASAGFLSAADLAASKAKTPTPQPKAVLSLKKSQASPKKLQFDQMRSRAMSAKPPGGQPESESNALSESLKRRHASQVETQNARVQAMKGSLVPPAGGSGKKGPPPAGASASGPAPIKPPPDPCAGHPLEISAVQSTPPLEPGEKLHIVGCGFGPHTVPYPGTVVLVGDGFPGGKLTLDVEGWFPTGILAKVPMIGGVPDIPTAKLQVVRSGQFSNQVDVGGFRATREVKRLLPEDVQISCGLAHPGDDAACAKAKPPIESSFFAGATFGAKRSRSIPRKDDCEKTEGLGAEHFEERTDTFTASLANGWTLAAYAWWWDAAHYSWVLAPTGYAPNATSATLTMKTGIYANECGGPYNASAWYRVDLYAVGPKGIPYK